MIILKKKNLFQKVHFMFPFIKFHYFQMLFSLAVQRTSSILKLKQGYTHHSRTSTKTGLHTPLSNINQDRATHTTLKHLLRQGYTHLSNIS